MTNSEILSFDKEHIWHPYTSMVNPLNVYQVESAKGVYIKLADGRELIDGMSSWWCAIQGYNNPRLNEAAKQQIDKMSHIMFGGFTHQPAVELAELLVEFLPEGLNRIFYSDSGSVSVEVALKMAIQYQYSLGKRSKTQIATIKGGYHGDTWHAMSVCDPENGMHSLYNGRLTAQLFVPQPKTTFEQEWCDSDLVPVRELFREHGEEIAGFILEPIVQGAGGMRFYHPNYLNGLRTLCDEYDILLIFDEIATGFGRTGKMFATEWTSITPDIITIGKALTAGYLSFAATIATDRVAHTISSNYPHSFMHGPTFMGNPLACSIAVENLKMLKEDNPLGRIKEIEAILKAELKAAVNVEGVHEVRCLGAIGVIEMKDSVDMQTLQAKFVENGIWVRPFGKLVYIMPQYIISDDELKTLCRTLVLCIK
ncbi:MAG: adenosylmethionine--8-amino-7-oxononanoate transaminase [Rikenellaceae bacterium]